MFPGAPDLLGPSWRLDNLYFTEVNGRSELKPKKTDEYMVKLEIDLDGDGNADTTEKTFF